MLLPKALEMRAIMNVYTSSFEGLLNTQADALPHACTTTGMHTRALPSLAQCCFVACMWIIRGLLDAHAWQQAYGHL